MLRRLRWTIWGLAWVVSPVVLGAGLSDDFNGPHDYLTQGVAGQIGSIAFDRFQVFQGSDGQGSGSVKAHDPQPADGSDDVTFPILSWQPGSTAAWHDVYLGVFAQSVSLVAQHLPGGITSYYHEPGFVPGATYYWRVDEIDQDGKVISGDLWSFMAMPYVAYKPGPAQGAEQVLPDDVTLSWKAGRAAIWHEVYFGTQADQVAQGTAGVFKGRQVSVSYKLGELADAVQYYWRVDEVAADGIRKWIGPVWTFTTLGPIQSPAKGLVGWWRFDEGSGSRVIDWSGNRNHGTLYGDPQWTDGFQAMALQFDGAQDYVVCGSANLPTGAKSFTVAAWVYPFVHNNTILWWGLAEDNRANGLRLIGGDRCRHSFWNNDQEFITGNLAGEWNHVAVTFDGSKRACLVNGLFMEGTHVGQLNGSPNVASTPLAIGGNSQAMAEFFEGVIDEVRVYNRALSADEISGLVRGDPMFASNPRPGNGEVVFGATPLAWDPAMSAVSYDVYLGTDRSAVRGAGLSDNAGLYLGRVQGMTYGPLELLVPGETYFWRVDAVDGGGIPSHGTVWNFALARSLVIDDFERYTADPPNRIFQTWLDGIGYTSPSPGVAGNGTGSVVGYDDPPYVETVLVHDGQSMPLFYNNTRQPFYSQADLMDPAPDWTVYQPGQLVLYFYGDRGNSVLAYDCLYIMLVDYHGQRVLTKYTGQIQDLADPQWHRWSIDLDSLINVDLAGIAELHIGIGDPFSPSLGGSGIVFIDDIRVESGL